MELFFF